MKFFYCVIILCAFCWNSTKAQTEAEKARMREDKKLLDATKRAYSVSENKNATSSSSSTTKSKETGSSTNSGGYVGGPNTAAENIMKGVFSERIAKEKFAEEQKMYGKRNANIEQVVKKYTVQMRLTYKYMKSKGIQNMEKHYLEIRSAAVASGISRADAETIFYAPNPGLGGIDHLPYYHLVAAGKEAEKELEAEGKEREKVARDKEKAERLRLATNYPNRLNLLKASVEKSGIPLTPNNYLQLRKLAQYAYFTTEESEEIFPFAEMYWADRPQIYREALPLSREFLEAKHKQKLEKEAQEKKQYEYELARVKAKSVEDAIHGRDLVIFTANKKKGLQTPSMATVLKPTYDSIGTFHNGFAVVTNAGKAGLINKRGEEKIAPQYKEGTIGGGIHIVMRKGSKYGVVDTLNNTLIPFEYDKIIADFRYTNLVIAKKGKKMGLLDKFGKTIIPFEFDDMYFFSEINGLIYLFKDKKEGLFDTSGNIVFPVEYQELTINKDLKLFIAEKDGKFGLLNYEGKEIAPIIYDELKGVFKDRLYKINRNGKWGYLNSATGKEVIPAIYDSLYDFFYKEKYVRGKRGDEHYDIDEKGNASKVSW